MPTKIIITYVRVHALAYACAHPRARSRNSPHSPCVHVAKIIPVCKVWDYCLAHAKGIYLTCELYCTSPLLTLMMSGMLLRVTTFVLKKEDNYVITRPHLIWLTGFLKKVEAAAKQKGCKIIGNWQRSIIIINYFYWCVSSTPDGNTETILAK